LIASSIIVPQNVVNRVTRNWALSTPAFCMGII